MNKWEKVEANKTHDFEEEKELIGIFIGAETNVGPNKSNLYTFKKSSGEMVGVWGNTVLDTRFKNLIEGEEVKIEYKGKTKSPKTGREYHDYDVFHRQPEVEDIPIIEEDELR